MVACMPARHALQTGKLHTAGWHGMPCAVTSYMLQAACMQALIHVAHVHAAQSITKHAELDV